MTTRTKRGTDDLHALDIRKIARAGLLKPGGTFTWQWTRRGAVVASIGGIVDTANAVTLHYRTRKPGGDWQDKRYQVIVDWTACNYGGKRPWWLCSCCGRRVAVLWGGHTYACRHCQQINYESTRTAESSKPFERADKVRRCCQPSGGQAQRDALENLLTADAPTEQPFNRGHAEYRRSGGEVDGQAERDRGQAECYALNHHYRVMLRLALVALEIAISLFMTRYHHINSHGVTV